MESYEVICREAQKRKADLVSLGIHSKKALLATVIASTSAGVTNNARFDVALLRI
ncbi:MAG: universal stress protein [Gammaproteobacteria bacterium]|nr:universal stress protein [Gammaproteobacteria bacterium]MDG2337612.1 universal stress protein [Gammaproteobacteria bacterium]